MDLIQESFQRLFPEKEFIYQTRLEYNLRLADFNANVKYSGGKIGVNLNLQWKDIDDEIKIGLIQSLLVKIFQKGKRLTTPNIELYNNFVKNINILTPKVQSEPELELSFQRVNERFFLGELEKPNLKWGSASRRKLASYNYHDDTVSVSTLFQSADQHILDYLMYHELLHKHHKFNHKNGRSFFHTREFKEAENIYPQRAEVEHKISLLIRTSKKKPKMAKFFDFFKS